MAFLGFFGGILLTTIIATGSDFYATRSGSVELLNHLWSMFVGLVGVVALIASGVVVAQSVLPMTSR